MKVSLILKIVGTLHVAVGGMLIYLLLFAHEMLMESMGADVSLKTFKTVQSTADVVGALNIGIGLLLVFCSYIKDLSSAKKVLIGEIALIFCMLCVALFNTFSTYWAPELPGYTGPPPPFWLLLVINPSLCVYGYFKSE